MKDYIQLLISFIAYIILFYLLVFIKIKELLIILFGLIFIMSYFFWYLLMEYKKRED